MSGDNKSNNPPAAENPAAENPAAENPAAKKPAAKKPAAKKPAAKKPAVKTKKVRFLLPPAGKFFLPYNVGQEVDLEEKQADEVIAAKYAEEVK